MLWVGVNEVRDDLAPYCKTCGAKAVSGHVKQTLEEEGMCSVPIIFLNEHGRPK